MRRYAILVADLFRWKIIRRIVSTAVAYCDWWGQGAGSECNVNMRNLAF